MEKRELNLSFIHEKIVESSNNGIIVIDREGKVVICNKAMIRRVLKLDIPMEEVCGTRLVELFYSDQNVIEDGQYISPIIETLETGKEYTSHECLLKIRNKRAHVLCDTKILRDDHGKPLGVLGIYRNITEQKELEESVRTMEKFVALGQLAAGLAHEIRNPLTVSKGFLQLLLKENKRYFGKRERDYLEYAAAEMDRIRDLVSEFLLLSKPAAPDFKKISIHKLVGDILSFMQGEALLNNIVIERELDSEVPHIEIDPSQMKQVFINLLKNSVDAMPQGGTITVRTIRHELFVQIDVRDTGTGIPYDQLNRIFDPFYTTKETGTGLGLPVSYRIIKNHNGDISVETSQEGTTFIILLPIAQRGAEKKDAPAD